MRILVLGGTRFIGPHVVRQLIAQGHQVTVYHRGDTETELPVEVRHVHDTRAAVPITAFPDELVALPTDVIIHMMAMGERDAHAAVNAFGGRAGRLVVLSSGDVYRAYGRFTGLEPGPVEPVPLHESSPLRTVLYPYREKARSTEDWTYWYEKILVEHAVLGDKRLSGVVLRLPKIYGRGGNSDFASVHQFSHRPQWRWTHGYVENVAAAVVLAAIHPSAAGKIYNVGEEYTPTVAERLADVSPSTIVAATHTTDHFEQDIVFDTSRIRRELGYAEQVPYREGLRRTQM